MRFHRHRQTFYLIIFLLFAAAAPVFAQPASQEMPCGELPECYDRTPTPPPPRPSEEVVPASESGHQTQPWEGVIDGRLNPEMTEYYSVWCANDFVYVLRSSPSPDTVAELPLVDVRRLGTDLPFLSVNGVVATRDGDTIVLAGSNGNLAPQPGTKTFSLSQCNERNGGTPPSSETNPPLAGPAQPVEGAQESTDLELMCGETAYVDRDSVLCGAAANPDSGVSILWRMISDTCGWLDIVPSVFTFVFVYRARRKREKRLLAEAERDAEPQ